LLYQVELVRLKRGSILRDAVQANLFHRLYFVVAQAAGVASFIAAHNKSLNTGLAIRSRSLFNTGCSQPVKQTLYVIGYQIIWRRALTKIVGCHVAVSIRAWWSWALVNIISSPLRPTCLQV
jgi:hypothetical protein